MSEPIATSELESLVAEHLEFLLDRWDRDPEYPFADTKIRIFTCADFSTAETKGTPFDKNVIYGWVQGRAMESLAGHIAWLNGTSSLPAETARSLQDRARRALDSLVSTLEAVRGRNGGRMTFMFDRDGTPCCVDGKGTLRAGNEIAGSANFSDLFCAKGLIAAGVVLDRPDYQAEGERYFRSVSDAIEEGRFVSDQEPLNRDNPPAHIEGRLGHGPAMISLGGLALLLRVTRNGEWLERAITVIRRILKRHVNTGQHPELESLDFTEFVDKDGRVWLQDGRVLSDPGHALEFAGLTAKCLLTAGDVGMANEAPADLVEKCEEVLPALLLHVFGYGFDQGNKGIVKTFDLVSRRPVNSQLPWWSLPETMRACVLVLRLFPQCEADAVSRVYRQCRDALFEKYLNPACHRLAYQTRDEEGKVVDIMPAFPDVDPCYHLGLTFLDIIRVLHST